MISYNYSTKVITVDATATLRSVYSDSMSVFAQSAQMDDLIPLRADTPTLFTLINSWTFSAGSIQYLTSAALQDAAGDNIWCNVQTLGSIVSGTTIYIDQAGTVWTAPSTGHINMLLKVRSGAADINSKNFTVYARKFGQTYDSFSTTGGAIVSNVPLATQADVNLDTTTYTQGTLDAYSDLTIIWGTFYRSAFDGASTTKYTLNGAHNNSTTTITVNEAIDASVPSSGYLQVDSEVIQYSGKTTYTFTGCTRGASSTTAASHLDKANLSTNTNLYNVNIKTTNAARTLKALYNWVQNRLLKTTDIDDGAGTRLGYITAKLIIMAGSTVFTQAGVWVEGFAAADKNNIQYTDAGSTNHIPPLSILVQINCDSGMNGGQAAVFVLDTPGLTAATYSPSNVTQTLINAAISSGVASTTLTYSADLPVRVVTRKAGYQQFELFTTITSAGLSVTAQNPVDSIYQ